MILAFFYSALHKNCTSVLANRTKGLSDSTGGLLLHLGEQVRIGVESDLNAGMAEPSTHRFGVDTP